MNNSLVMEANKLELRIIGNSKTLKINFKLFEGDRVSIMGPSGCGKTTFLKALAGLYPMNGVSLMVDGENVLNSSPKSRDISFVFQGGALFPHLSVEENLYLALKYSRRYSTLSKKESLNRIEEYLNRAQLSPKIFLKRNASELSGGERQRVAVLRALIVDAKTILMDEAFSALDEDTKESMIAWTRECLKTSRSAVLFVTHIKAEAEMLGSKIIEWNRDEDEIHF